MLQRRRKRPTDPAIAELAGELLEAGDLLAIGELGVDVYDVARVYLAREAARRAGYAIGVTYCDASLNRGRERRIAAAHPAAKKKRLDRAKRFAAIADAAAAVIRADAGV